jgi:hypothetical protein
MKTFRLTRLKIIIFVLVVLPFLVVLLLVFALISEPCSIQAADPESYPEYWAPDHPGQVRCVEFQKCIESYSFSKCYWESIVNH